MKQKGIGINISIMQKFLNKCLELLKYIDEPKAMRSDRKIESLKSAIWACLHTFPLELCPESLKEELDKEFQRVMKLYSE